MTTLCTFSIHINLKMSSAQKDFALNYARSQFSAIIGTNDGDRRKAFYRIKSHLDFPELCIACDYIEKNTHIRFQKYLSGNPLPKSYKDLGVCDFMPITEHTIREINWTLIAIRKHALKINEFLNLKEMFDKKLLLGKYSECEKCLSKIETEIYYSLWTLCKLPRFSSQSKV